MLQIKGSGILRFEDKEIPFENRVNDAFVMAAQSFIDVQKLSGNYVGQGLRDVPATAFMLLSNPADFTMKAVYNRLGFISISNFSVIAATPRKTTIRGAGIMTTGGTVRSAGFNPLCEETPPTGNDPLFNVPTRKVELRVEGIATIPAVDNWVYVPAASALFRYTDSSTEIWKIPFNPATGVFGTPVMVTNAFTRTGSATWDKCNTDGVSKIFRFTNTTTNAFIVFDCVTETLQTISLSKTIGINQLNYRCWDEFQGLWCTNYVGGTTADMININTGVVTSQIKEAGQAEDLRIIYEKYKIDNTYIRKPYGNAIMGRPWNGTSWQAMESIISKSYRFPDSNGWQLMGTFNTASSPGIFTMQWMREPDTSMTIFNIPAQTIAADTPFTIDYTFEVTDTR